MRSRYQLVTGAVVLGAVAAFLASSRAADDDETKARNTILKMANTLSQNKVDDARQQAQQLKDTDLDDIMPLFALRTERNKKALGMGASPGAIKPDGIEKKIEVLARKPLSPSELTAEAPAIEQAAYVAAAIALVIHDKCPVQAKEGNKDPNDWKRWSDDMDNFSMKLAAAAKARDPAGIQKAADQLDGTCKSCHAPFK